MDADARKLLARAKALRLGGLSQRAIGRKLKISPGAVAGLFYRERHGFGIGPRQYEPTEPRPEREPFHYERVPYRRSSCAKHLRMIYRAHGQGFPYITPDYRRAA